MAKPKRLSPRKPPPKDHAAMVRFSREQFQIIDEAAKRSGIPFAVFCRSLILQGIAQGAEDRLRGNPYSYVDGARHRDESANTCPEHTGEPLFVTPDGATCRMCSASGKQSLGAEDEPSRGRRAA